MTNYNSMYKIFVW